MRATLVLVSVLWSLVVSAVGAVAPRQTALSAMGQARSRLGACTVVGGASAFKGGPPLASPRGVGLDAAGNLYIADSGNNVVRLVDHATGTITTVAGMGQHNYSGDGGPATKAELYHPEGVALDAAGNLYIADSGNSVVRQVDHATGTITTVAGTGQSGYSGDGGTATKAQLAGSAGLPGTAGVALDAAGNLYIADSGNSVVRRVDHATRIITTVAGTGQHGYSGDGGPAPMAKLAEPAGVALDAAGNLYIADSGNYVVRRVDHATGTITTVPTTDAAFPDDVTLDAAGNLYIADLGSRPNWDTSSPSVWRVDHATGITTAITGGQGYSGDGGPATEAQQESPAGVALDRAGNLYIADSDNNVVRRVNHATGIITTVAGTGPRGPSVVSGPATEAEHEFPAGVALDGAGNLYIADSSSNVVRRVDHATRIITTIAGTGQEGYSGDGGPATKAQLVYPVGLALDAVGNLYIADSGNSVVRRVDHATRTITTLAGTGREGCSGDRGPATRAQLSNPKGLALDAAGNLYIADSGNDMVRRVDHATGLISTVAGTGVSGYSGDGRSATRAQLNNLTGLALDAAANLYIGDSSNHVVRRVDHATGTISTVAGTGDSGYSGDGGPATKAKLAIPEGLALDAASNLYIADTHLVRRLDHVTGIISTVAGTGRAGYGADCLPAIKALLNNPEGLALDAAGNLYIAEPKNNVVRRVDQVTGIITTVVGTGHRVYHGGVGSAELANPEVVALDAAGNLYIADTGNSVVRRVDQVTGISTTVAGTGYSGCSGDGGPATMAQLVHPVGLALDAAGNLYIADSSYNVVRRVDHATGTISTVAGTGVSGYSGDGGSAARAQLNNLTGLALDTAGNLYIADSSNNVVRRVDHATRTISTLAGTGREGYSGDSGSATRAQLSNPKGLALDAAGNLYIADSGNSVVRRVDHATRTISTVAGTGVSGYSGDGGSATRAQLNNLTGLALDTAGNLYIADSGNSVVRRVDHATRTITTLAGTGQRAHRGDCGPATRAQLSDPEGLALDAAGNLYIADSGNSVVRRVDHAMGTITTVAGMGQRCSDDSGLATKALLAGPTAVALDGAGNLYIADSKNNVVRRVDHATGIISTVAGTGPHGYSGDGGPATKAQLSNPQGLALDAAGNLYIADSDNSVVRRVDHATGTITTVATNKVHLAEPAGLALDAAGNLYIADASPTDTVVVRVEHSTGSITTVAGTGQNNYSGDGGPATKAELVNPVGLALDATGNLFIVDSFTDSVVRRVDHATGIITTVVGTGRSGYSGDGGPATKAQLFYPEGVALDAAGNLYIGDSSNHVVRRVDHATGTITTVAGTGRDGYSGDGGPATKAQLNNPKGLALDAAGNLYIADSDNSVVRRVDHTTGIITTVAGSGQSG